MEVPPELGLSSNCEMVMLRGPISCLELTGGCDPKTFWLSVKQEAANQLTDDVTAL